MAEGRMLKKRISKSHKFAALKTHNARLLYLMIYPHLDVKGRIDADPTLIKGEITPLLNFSRQKIWEYLEDMHNVGLLRLYKVNGQWYLDVSKFLDFQSLRPEREADSQCPDPPEGQLPELDGRTPAKVNVSKGKVSKGYSPKFLTFWSKFKGRWNADKSRYDKGGKSDASVEFEKLPAADQEKATAAAHKTGGKYTQDACRWLKGKRWEV